MALIVDLDCTLIGSKAAEQLRRQRSWTEVYKLIPTMRPYRGINNLITMLNKSDIPIAIVTSSPGTYCARVIKQWEWKIDATVCYHDTNRHKPYPDPILAALEKLETTAAETVAAGDQAIDIQAAKSAKVFSVGCSWGAEDSEALEKSKPDLLVTTVEEFFHFLKKRFHIRK